MLAKIQQQSDATQEVEAGAAGAGKGKGGGVSYPLPQTEADTTALLEWAYFEASSIVRQYGDLLEEVQGFMETGSSTVGESVLMIEDELS